MVAVQVGDTLFIGTGDFPVHLDTLSRWQFARRFTAGLTYNDPICIAAGVLHSDGFVLCYGKFFFHKDVHYRYLVVTGELVIPAVVELTGMQRTLEV